MELSTTCTSVMPPVEGDAGAGVLAGTVDFKPVDDDIDQG